jgi:hypothetical protein
LETVEGPAPPVALNEDPNIYSCRRVRSRKGRGVTDLYSELINLRFVEDINCSSARRHEGGKGGRTSIYFARHSAMLSAFHGVGLHVG